MNEKIIIERDDNQMFIQYGDKNASPFICIKVHLVYDETEKDCFIPVACGRYGFRKDFDSIHNSEELQSRQDFKKYLEDMYEDLRPEKTEKWNQEIRNKYVKQSNPHIIARALINNINCKVQNIVALPNNANSAKPLESLRKAGLIIITEIESGITYWRLVEGIYARGFQSENIPSNTRKKVLRVLGYVDALSGERMNSKELVVEHKFPEQRWGGRKAESNSNMSEDEIKNKFQLLTRQYNMVKREACEQCVACGERQAPFGISFFYEGDENWSCEEIEGVGAEDGCIGCGWYDMAEWKRKLIIAANREDE